MVGTTISHYKVLEKIGEGGMGEVYRATDTKLNRDVALKILPEQFASDSQRMGRFQREAEVLASLDHPNIGQIYGIEEAGQTKALVLQLIEGPTLAERIAQGPIPVEDALKIALQMAEGLEAAHEKGVIHRDLKPANIKITPEGQVKILDFGLAKALEGETPPDTKLSQSPTLTAAATQAGVILGTAAYMSPEQARGEATDKKADVWAFGCVMFEMLTRRATFGGKTVSDVLAGVLRIDPEWKNLPPNLHPRIRLLLERSLEKESKDRYQGIADARVDIQTALADPSGVLVQPTGDVAQAAPQSKLPWVAAAVVLTAVTAGVAVWILAPQPTRPVARFVVGTSATEPFSSQLPIRGLAISPDGTSIVYRSSAGGGIHVYLRQMDQLGGTRLFSAQNNIGNPFFSPDGAWVVFSTNDDATWKKVSILGGPPVTLFPNEGAPRGASWGPDDTILFAHNVTGKGLARGPAAGGDLEVLTTPDAEQGEINHWWPEILPGGEAVLFTIVKGQGTENMEIAVLDLATREQKVLIRGGSNPLYAVTGHIIYGVEGTLRAVPFDLDRLEVTGEPVPVLEGVMTAGSGAAEFSLSADGSLVYVPGGNFQGMTLAWVNRQGQATPLTEDSHPYGHVRLSPNGNWATTDIASATGFDIWIYDVERKTNTRLTFEGSNNRHPIWTPDGNRVTFDSDRSGDRDLYWKPADGSDEAELLLTKEGAQVATSWSPDGQILAFEEQKPTGDWDISLLPLEGDRTPVPFLDTPFTERGPMFSPDGKWIAYVSNESGRNEVYVQPYPGPGGKRQISTDGGVEPVWSANGRELFYREGTQMVAVAVGTQPTFTAGTPQVLFAGAEYPLDTSGHPGYDVSADGQHFLMKSVPQDAGSTPLYVVLNWFEELKERVPVP